MWRSRSSRILVVVAACASSKCPVHEVYRSAIVPPHPQRAESNYEVGEVIAVRARSGLVIALAIGAVLTLGAMAAAADPVPVLTASRTALSYPDSTRLISSVTTPSVIVRRREFKFELHH